MPRFEFRLKTLLAVREATRDGARAQLAESLEEARTLNPRQGLLERELNDQREWLRGGTAPGRIDVDRVLTASRYEFVLRRKMQVLAEQQRALALEIERRRQAVLEADREVRVLEKLRERQFEQFQRQQALVEVKQLDEVAVRATYHQDPA